MGDSAWKPSKRMRVNPTSGPITGDTMESRWNAELQNCRFHLWRHSVVLKRSIGSDSYSMIAWPTSNVKPQCMSEASKPKSHGDITTSFNSCNRIKKNFFSAWNPNVHRILSLSKWNKPEAGNTQQRVGCLSDVAGVDVPVTMIAVIAACVFELVVAAVLVSTIDCCVI
ncbi:hypothetical protein CAPTEDRAFT_229217 [Capitella teleta]|uniref:Uncharacterized protein n=1 Tax=Capitella teleta TaxID=283909 RepID=R7TVN4_CAPTE|nr:hypothetical protein CAPTEDRAFT_229217 [Capitella teleta]|eukprot:ELT97948.1 hypothetical protein CAPTEDRAFT_229217 [Capitella teleta]